jgi:hypothetical protein
MKFEDIKLGQQYWCVLKTTIVDAEQKDYPEFLVHFAQGYVTSKGMQKKPSVNNEAEAVLFVEIAGQRVRHTHIFESPEDAIDKAEAMIAQIQSGEVPA